MKKPWLAALLNLIPGLGYIYLRRRLIFACLLLAVIPISILAVIVDPVWSEMPVEWAIWDTLILATSSAAFVVDAFMEAKAQNNNSNNKASKALTE